MNDQVQRFWRTFVQSSACPPGVHEDDVPLASGFGDHPAEADELGQLVYAGLKTASCSELWEYDGDPLPAVGQLEIVLDGHGQPLCVLEMTEVETKPYNAVDASFAYDEGEDDRTLEAWRRAHWRYFSRVLARVGRTPEETMPLICQRLRVIFKV